MIAALGFTDALTLTAVVVALVGAALLAVLARML